MTCLSGPSILRPVKLHVGELEEWHGPKRLLYSVPGGTPSPSPYLVLPYNDTPEVVRWQPHPLDSPMPLGRKGKERQGGGRWWPDPKTSWT